MIEMARFIQVSAKVRYWEDAEINGKDANDDGIGVPFKNGDLWEPLIDLENGSIIDWPQGIVASFHFKVCDNGSYYLLDDNKNVLSYIEEAGVPSGLCHGDSGYGDYIIFRVDDTGKIVNYRKNIEARDWEQ